MAFIVKKVNLEDSSDPIICFANTMLLFSSLTHDALIEKNYESAKQQMEMLLKTIENIYRIIGTTPTTIPDPNSKQIVITFKDNGQVLCETGQCNIAEIAYAYKFLEQSIELGFKSNKVNEIVDHIIDSLKINTPDNMNNKE